MNLFNRLFGKKPKIQAPAEPEPAQQQKPAQQIDEKAPVAAKPPVAGKHEPAAKKTPVSPAAAMPKKARPKAEAGEAKETIPWRTFSIFISSTFADMQAERDHLKNVVFPAVDEELHKRRIKLEIVDLRWGVDTTSIEQESEREANVLKVCLDEIKRCRPFFIGLLGDRYGWTPSEQRMADAVVGEGLTVPLKGKSVTELEIEFGVLASKEQLVRSAFYFRDPLPYDEFPPQRAKLFCDRYDPKLSEAEKTSRQASLEALKAKIRKYFEQEKHPEKVKKYAATWDAENEKVTGLEAFGEMVMGDILAECEGHAKETWDEAPQNWQEQELALLDAFINHHTHTTTFITKKGEEHVPTFCGRKPLLEELKQHLLSADAEHWGLVLTGESGSGKSAVFSMVHKMMEKEGCFILAHSAGLSPRAKHVADLLKIWNNLLRKELGMEQEDASPPPPSHSGEGPGVRSLSPGEVPEESPETPIEQLQQQFAELLSMAAKNKRLVLLIDALDRFEPTGRAQAMSWLPALMPRNVRLLCTAINGTEEKATKYHRGLQSKSIDIFTPEEAREMIGALGQRHHKHIPAGITKLILEKKTAVGQPASSSPLWLSLAVNILMALDQDDFEEMSKFEGRGDQQIETYLTNLAKGFDPLPGKLFLSLIEKAGILFGPEFTRAVFDYIAVSRNGLREKDLEALLPAEGIVWDPLRYAMLRRWFRAHLVMQGEELQWNLAHSILDNTLLGNLTEQEGKAKHLTLGSYLMFLPDADALKISETMYHLMQADSRETAAGYYSSYRSNNLQTDSSSKALAEAMILDDAQQKSDSLEWIVSLAEAVSQNNDRLYTLMNNFMFSLHDKHLQSDTTVKTRVKLMVAVEKLMEELCRRKQDSADYARDLSISYERLGDLYLKLGDPSKALDKYQASLTIREELNRRNHESADYARDLMISYERMGTVSTKFGKMDQAMKSIHKAFDLGLKLHRRTPDSAQYSQDLARYYLMLGDLYLKLGDTPKTIDNYQASLKITEELCRCTPESEDYARVLSVSYIKLGDLYIKLGVPPNALDKYQASLKIAEELRRRTPDSADYASDLSISYERLGDLYLKLGNPPKALDKYQASLKIDEELCLRVPDSADYASGLSKTYNKLGDLYLKLGDTAKALDKYLTSLKIAEELHCRAPNSAEYARDLSVTYHKLGDLYMKLGDTAKALDKYQASLKIDEEICLRAPESAEYARELSVTYNKLGDLYMKLGATSKAIDNYQASLTIREELRRRAPESADYARDAYVSYWKLGDHLLQMGEISKAFDKHMASLEIAKELHIRAPDSADYARDLSMSYEKSGDLYLKLGNYLKALDKYQASLKINEELRRRAPESAEYANDLSVSYSKLGYLYLKLGDTAKALDQYQISLNIAEELCRRAPESADYARDLSVLYNRLGDWYLKLGDLPKALEIYQAWLTLAEELRHRAPDSAEYARDLSVSYDRLGDLFLQLGEPPKALDKYQASLAIREELRRRAPESADYARDLMISYERMGTFSTQLGNMDQAMENIQKAFDLSQVLHQKAPDSAQYSQDLARYYFMLGDLYLQLGAPPKALDNYQASHDIFEELRHRAPNSAEFARDYFVSCHKIMALYSPHENQQGVMEYAMKCKEALIYMRDRGMPMEEKMIEFLNQLENAGI